MKKLVKKVLSKIKKSFSVKTPISYPILQGELLNGRTALITGGGSGIGYSIAESFVRNGANVVICGRNEKKLSGAVEKLKKIAGEKQTVEPLALDISDTEHMGAILDECLSAIKVDILVNNAGVGNGNRIGSTSVEDFEQLMKINLEGTYFISQYFLNYMKSNKIKGNIFFIASSSSLRPAHSPYIVSKWGIMGLVKGLAKVAIKHGITVNGIAPGPTATPMLGKEGASDISLDSNPSGRYAMPEEMANLATVLVSDMGKMVIGDVLFATGGAGVITLDDIDY